MDNLVVANIKQRKTRTAISILGVAIGVVLILVTVGLARGMLKERAEREANVGAEIMFSRGGSFSSLSTKNLLTDVRYADIIKTIEGVEAVTPVGQYISSGATGIGFEMVDGIDFDSYSAISKLRIVSGHALTNDSEVIIDAIYAKDRNKSPGDTVEVLGQQFRVAGIYAPESLGRVKMTLSKMQQLLVAPNKCFAIYVKCKNPEEQEAVAARIRDRLPDNFIGFTRDIPGLYAEASVPALDVFLNAVVAVAVVISAMVILLAMYTTITERTREIGILKSLGASKGFIIGIIEREALLISVLGIISGFIFSLVARAIITRVTTLRFIEFEPKWILIASSLGLLAGFLGAFYPAIRAANQDPVKALSYE